MIFVVIASHPIAARLRTGELSLARVEEAARLGHEWAMLYTGIAAEDGRKLEHGIALLPEREQRLIAADYAEAVLPIYEREYPDDDRPRRAILVARRYALGLATADADLAAAWAAAGAARDAAYAAARAAARAAAQDEQRALLARYLVGEVRLWSPTEDE